MNKYFYPIFKLPTFYERDYVKEELPLWIKWWLLGKAGRELSEILTGSEFTLLHTLNRKFKIFQLNGRTEQEQLEGYNLLEVTNVYEQTIRNGVTIETNQDGTITLNGTATANMDVNFMGTNPLTEIELEANQNYILSKKVISGSASRIMIAYYLAGATSTFTTDTKDLGSNTDIRTLQNCRIFISTGDVFNNVTVGLMLLKGSTDKKWEPYTNGLATPNPNYIEPIKNVTGNAKVKIQNKNLFDKDNATTVVGYFSGDGSINYGGSSTITTSYSEIKPNTDMIVSGCPIEAICFYDKNKNFIERSFISANVSFNKNAYFIRLQAPTNTFDINKLQLEQGSTATSYVPHQEQNYPFTFAQSQRGMQGTELKDDGIHQKRARVDLSTLTWSQYATNKYQSSSLSNVIKKPSSSTIKANILAEKYIVVPQSASFTNGVIGVETNGAILCMDETGIPSGILEYELAEEEIIPYNETQQAQYNAIKNARSYDDITYITSESDELPPLLEIQYWKERGAE